MKGPVMLIAAMVALATRRRSADKSTSARRDARPKGPRSATSTASAAAYAPEGAVVADRDRANNPCDLQALVVVARSWRPHRRVSLDPGSWSAFRSGSGPARNEWTAT